MDLKWYAKIFMKFLYKNIPKKEINFIVHNKASLFKKYISKKTNIKNVTSVIYIYKKKPYLKLRKKNSYGGIGISEKIFEIKL